MHLKRATALKWGLLSASLASVGLLAANCGLMPKALKSFFALPLPDVATGGYPVSGGRIGYVVSGRPEGIPVVFLHGSPGSWEDWKLVLQRPRLTSRFCLVAVDRPGWGMSADTGVLSFAEQSRRLATVLTVCGPDRPVILVGHSLGGPLAVRMAADYPEQVAALVLLAPALDPDLDTVRWYNRLADNRLAEWLLPDRLGRSNDEILKVQSDYRRLGRDMAALTLPTLLIHGAQDRLVSPKNSDYARRKMIRAELRQVILPNFGHLIPHLRPAEVVLAVEWAAAAAGDRMPAGR
jgi:pimeloyl-ACP methyl ester carboxylesterase